MQLIHIEPQTSGEAGGITSSLRCEIAACRKPEERQTQLLRSGNLLFTVHSALNNMATGSPHSEGNDT